MKRTNRLKSAVFLTLLLTPPAALAGGSGTSGPLVLFDATVQTAQAQLEAAAKPDGAWALEASKLRQELVAHGQKTGDAQVQMQLQNLLAKLDVGRIELLSSEEQRYWTYLSAFSGSLEAAPLRHIGAWYERHGKNWFITTVFADGPAARAGLEAGDEVLEADGRPFAPVTSFRDAKPEMPVQLTFRRLPWGQLKTVTVVPELSSLQTALLRAMTHGRTLLNVKHKRVAYVALPMSANPAFRAALLSAATQAQMQADAMVLDLRGDYGAVGMTYSEPFLSPPAGTGVQPAAAITPFAKPLVVLIDAGTSGGRENLAWLLKRQHRAVIVGHASAGAIAPVQATEVLAERYLLVVPVIGKDPALRKLGVNPDIASDPPHIYTAGNDQSLALALAKAADLAP